MGINTNVTLDSSRFYRLMSKRGFNASTTFGFEWEIPLDRGCAPSLSDDMWDDLEDCEDLYYNLDEADRDDFYNRVNYGDEGTEDTPFLRTWMEKMGYKYHLECGGLEIDSPVFNHLGMARAHARHMIDAAAGTGYFSMDGNIHRWNDCGIHVHVARPGASPTTMSRIRQMASMIHNRQENQQLVWDMTGREDSASYDNQGSVTGWDTHRDSYYCDYDDCRIVDNNPGGDQATVEFRMFSSASGLLVPAIEYAHSMFNFAATKVAALDLSESEWQAFTSDEMSNTRYNRYVPRLCAYRRWINHKPQYRHIKQHINAVA